MKESFSRTNIVCNIERGIFNLNEDLLDPHLHIVQTADFILQSEIDLLGALKLA